MHDSVLPRIADASPERRLGVMPTAVVTGATTRTRTGPCDLVRWLRAHVSGTGPAGHCQHLRPARLPPGHAVACLRIGQILNQSDLARDISISQPTAHRYLNLLETSYLFVRLPAYAVNRTKRLVKSPKAYWSDTGLAMHLSQESEPRGGHLENIVLHDLLAWRDSRMTSAEHFY